MAVSMTAVKLSTEWMCRVACKTLTVIIIIIYYMNRTPSTTKNRKKERDRQTDRQQNAISNQQSARGQIIHNVHKVTDGERIRQA